jgi:hypothetical protein
VAAKDDEGATAGKMQRLGSWTGHDRRRTAEEGGRDQLLRETMSCGGLPVSCMHMSLVGGMGRSLSLLKHV